MSIATKLFTKAVAVYHAVMGTLSRSLETYHEVWLKVVVSAAEVIVLHAALSYAHQLVPVWQLWVAKHAVSTVASLYVGFAIPRLLWRTLPEWPSSVGRRVALQMLVGVPIAVAAAKYFTSVSDAVAKATAAS